MTEANASENTYVFEAEDATEVARLFQRNELFHKTMGGLFPERTDLDGITHILDIGCGPGGWAVDVAKRYPHIQVIGIDVSTTMITSAKIEAQRQTVNNVTFMHMDALQPLNFPLQYFDLVNMRAAVEYIPRKRWIPLLQECYRITRSGGILRLIETDRIALTNSYAFERYHYFYTWMLYLRGYGFSPDGWTLGMTPVLPKLLQDAGYQHIHIKSYALDFSYNALFHSEYRRLSQIRFENVRRHLHEKGLIPLDELEKVYYAFIEDIARETFCGVACPLILWGEK
jgi:ubiquinone/menaquinone biosynthesis C-methylase UbiE